MKHKNPMDHSSDDIVAFCAGVSQTSRILLAVSECSPVVGASW